MMSRTKIHALLISIMLASLPAANVAQTITQNTISTIAKSDPLIISGAIGTQNTYYYSSIGSGYRSPWSNTFYANLNISVYGISMPFAFYYGNNNTSWNFPHISFHIDPTYKNWRGHFGRSNMGMSNYIMNMSFNGVGLEYNSAKWRFGAFYGQLRNAINDDPTDPSARNPQYRRMGWGLKAGYGSGANFIDLYFLRSYDRIGSLDDYWQERLRPKDNIAVAIKAGMGLTKWLNLRGNLAFSAITQDSRALPIENSTTDKWASIFDTKYTSLMRIAGDVSANLSLRNFRTSVFYRMVQPDFTTLGLYYINNNYQSLGINASTTLFKKIALSATFSGQEDNITRNQLYTTRGFVYSANASMQVNTQLSLMAGYNGYRQLQSDGKAHVNDTTRVNRVMNSFHFTPTYVIQGETLDHAFSLTGSYVENKDLNEFATGQSDVKSIAAGLGYNLNIQPWEMSVNASLSHQQSEGYNTRYTSDVFTVGAGHSFLKEKNLHTSATMSLCYNNIKDRQKMLTLGGYMSASYTHKKVHVFSLSAGVNKYSDVNISDDNESRGTTEFTASLNYAYTFSLLHLKRNADKKDNGNKEK